jgi:membrane protease YdiL (CAAX protease family)
LNQEERGAHFPGPGTAVLLTFAAWFAAGLVIALLGIELDIAAIGIGEVVGLGLVATLAARRVPPPQPERLGLCGFSPGWIPTLVLLIPLMLLTSELDNIVQSYLPTPDAAEIEASKADAEPKAGEVEPTTLEAVQTAIVVVGLAPVVEEWLFRGVLQQGLIAHLGPARGLLVTAALFAAGHLSPTLAPASSAVLVLSSLILGLVLGAVRLASGSILAPILLHAAINGVALAAISFDEVVAIPGFNAEGAHTPLSVLLPALVCVTIGANTLVRALGGVQWVLPIAPTRPQRGDGW